MLICKYYYHIKVIAYIALSYITLAISVYAEVHRNTLIFASDYWQHYVETDGSGLMRDLLTEIYTPAGYNINIKTLPKPSRFSRLQQGHINAWIGVYAAKHMNKLSIKYAMANPHYPIATSIITAFCQPALKSRTKTLNWKLPRGKEAQDLQNIIYAWTRAYGYDQIIGIPKTLLANTTEGGLKMLLAERLDCFVGPKEETTFAARALNVDIEKYPTKEIAKRNVYLLFLNTQANPRNLSPFTI